jgi:hypothetical protein
MRHVEIGEQKVKACSGNRLQRFAYAPHGNDLKTVAFERFPQHVTDSLVVLG